MLRLSLLLIGLMLLDPALARQEGTPLSDRRVAYRIDATLDADARTITARQRLSWRNDSPAPVRELQFHLYLNAFKPGSTFLRESGGSFRGASRDEEDRWGGIEISRMRIADDEVPDLTASLPRGSSSGDLTAAMRFIQPDDGNTEDQTVMAVTLPNAVRPGETIELDIDFVADLPRIMARTGWEEDTKGRTFVMAGQWFPKVAVLELPGQRYVPADAPAGVWNAHQFHANSEFYADFGTYDVTLRVPSSMVVGATGVRTAASVTDSVRTLRYRADDVHDFAWTAYPDHLVVEESWEHVTIRLMLRPEHAGQVQRHLDATRVALQYLTDWVGPYPYATLTVVDAIGQANGMEYPTLVTGFTMYPMPSWVRLPEMVLIHEIGHQYFYGLLASNEFEEAWLDEGVTSYLESRIMDVAYGDGSLIDIPDAPLGNRVFQRLSYTLNNPSSGALFTRSWEHRPEDYGKASYSKPATALNTLEGYLGWETMQRFLHAYYERWRFRHPTTRDLQDVLEDVAGQDMDWFFDAYVYGTDVLDYAVDAIDSEAARAERYTSTVRVKRLEDGSFPTVVRVTFADGSVRDEPWDGRESQKTFTFTHDARAVSAVVDPDGLLWLETHRLNNGLTLEPGRRFATRERLRFTARIQQLIIVLTGLF